MSHGILLPPEPPKPKTETETRLNVNIAHSRNQIRIEIQSEVLRQKVESSAKNILAYQTQSTKLHHVPPEATILTFDTQLCNHDTRIELKSVDGRMIFQCLFEVRIVLLVGYRTGTVDWLGFGRDMARKIGR
jgi:hypothetical protein